MANDSERMFATEKLCKASDRKVSECMLGISTACSGQTLGESHKFTSVRLTVVMWKGSCLNANIVMFDVPITIHLLSSRS